MYAIEPRNPGTLLIINNRKFKIKSKIRKGSEHNVKRLKEVFKERRFDVVEMRNLTAQVCICMQNYEIKTKCSKYPSLLKYAMDL